MASISIEPLLRWPRVRGGVPDVRALAVRAVVALVGLVGFTQTFWKVVGPDFAYLPGDLVDNRFNHYVLEHGSKTLAHGKVKAFWNAPFMYPAPMMTAGSDHHIGTLPLYAGLRAVGVGPERAFQIWFLGLSVLNFVAAYAAARVVGLQPLGAAAAAYLYAFGLPNLGQVGHAQLAARFPAPLAVAFFWRFLWQPRTAFFLGLALAGLAQIYCNIYLGVFTALLLTGMGGIAVLLAGRQLPWRELLRPGRAVLGRRALILLPCLALVVLLVLPYQRMSRSHAAMPTDEIVNLAPDLAAWVRPPAQSWAWGWSRDTPAAEAGVRHIGEKVLFPGALAVAGLAFGLAGAFRRRIGAAAVLPVVCALVAAAVPLVFCRFGDWSLYQEAIHLPVVGKLRAIGRVVFVLMIPLGFLVGFLFEFLQKQFAGRSRTVRIVVALGLVGLLAGDQATVPHDAPAWADTRISLAHSADRRARFAAAVREHPAPRLVYSFPGGRDGFYGYAFLVLQVDTMWGALEAGVPTVNGHTGYPPRVWYPFENYGALLWWLKENDRLTPDVMGGLVTFGRPVGADDSPVEQAWRKQMPPRPWPVVP